MRYPRSGTATSNIGPATDVSTGGGQVGPPTLLPGGITTGRVFWLRGLSLAVNALTDATEGPINLYDAASGTTTTTAPVLRLDGACVSGALFSNVLFPSRMVYNFGAPGVKFSTGVAAIMETCGKIPPGHLVVWGYEE